MKLRLLFIAVFLIFSAVADGQIVEKIDPVVYENHQRASRLKAYRHEIQSLENSLIKCYQREIIAKFIIERKVTEEYATAEDFINECLEDTVKREDDFPYMAATYIKSDMFVLLRRLSPAKAESARKKYSIEEQKISNDIEELRNPENIEAYTDRAIAEILNGTLPSSLLFAIPNFQLNSPPNAVRLLTALLIHFERTPVSSGGQLVFDMLLEHFLNDTTPADMTIKLLRIVLRFAQTEAVNFGRSNTITSATSALRKSLPFIRDLMPDDYQSALATYAILNSRRSREAQKKDEVYDRINESDDKLSRIISEAEAADDKELKKELWIFCGREAVKQQKFRIAVDCLLKYGPGGTATTSNLAEFFISKDVLESALRVSDIESADYALANIENILERGSGHLKVFARLIELKRNDEAFERLQTALKTFEKADNTAWKINKMLEALPNALRLDENAGFNLVREAIKIANRLPLPDPPKSEDRTAEYTYLLNTNVASILNFATAFRQISKLDVDLAFSLANQLDSKAWKMAAMLIVETERKYPVPENPDEIHKETEENNLFLPKTSQNLDILQLDR